MPLADDLVDQAYRLALFERGKPKQASLRRAVSTAYYAIFHLLVSECAQQVASQSPTGLSARIGRSLTHSEMRDVCASLTRSNLPVILQGLQPNGFSAELRRVAEIFVQLQEARQIADYDVEATFNRAQTLDIIERVAFAFTDWKTVRQRDEAAVFLAALMFAKRWSK